MKRLQRNSAVALWGVMMCLLATPVALADMPKPIFDVYDYGAVGDGLTKNTVAFQKTIDACHDAGGGTVWFHKGTFVTGQVELKGGITYFIDKDATILGSEDASDYPTVMPYEIPYCHRSMFHAFEADNITIDGKGIIDGRGWAEAWRPAKGIVHLPPKDRPLILRFFRCDNLMVKNITLKNAAMWVQVYDQCNHVTIDGIKVDSVVNHSDGLNITDSHHVVVKNCNIYSDDDAVVLKSFCGRGLDDIVIKNNTLGTPRAMCFKIGTETCGSGLITNIRVTDNIGVCGTGGIELASVDGANIDGVIVDDFEMHNIIVPIFLRLGNRNRYGVGKVGSMKNITLRNIKANDTRGAHGCVISGIPGHNIQNVTLEDMYIEMKGGLGHVPPAPPENEAAYPVSCMFGNVPAYGFYVRHADNITFKNVVIGYERNDARDWLVTEDATVNAVNCTNAGLLGGTIMVDDRESSITYSGSWMKDKSRWTEGKPGNFPWAGPLYFPCYNRSRHYSDSNANSDCAEFGFNGTSIKWIGTKADDKGKVEVYIDGVLDAVIDCYSPTPRFQAELYSKSSLSNGLHTIKLQEANKKHPSSSGHGFTVDAFAFTRKNDDTSSENQMTEKEPSR
jgi:polygalacturonase